MTHHGWPLTPHDERPYGLFITSRQFDRLLATLPREGQGFRFPTWGTTDDDPPPAFQQTQAVADIAFGPWCPTRRLGPPQPPLYWCFTAYFGHPLPLGLHAPCGHPLHIEPPIYELPWHCAVCGSNVMFPIHRGPRETPEPSRGP
jgi:hypothetical protein